MSMKKTWKKRTMLSAVALVSAGLWACTPNKPGGEANEQSAAEAEANQVDQMRDQFTERTEQRLDALKEDMGHLKDEVDESKAPPQVQQQLDDWDARLSDLEDKVDHSKSASLDDMDSWRDFENEVNQALNDLRSSYQQLAQELRKTGD